MIRAKKGIMKRAKKGIIYDKFASELAVDFNLLQSEALEAISHVVKKHRYIYNMPFEK